MVSYQLETWDEFYPDCLPLMEQEHAELGETDDGWRCAPDRERCAAAVSAGVAQVTTARLNGSMIGYCVFYVAPNLEDAGNLVAPQGPWFVVPEHRGGMVTYRLFLYALRQIEKRGVSRAFPHHWLVGDSPKAARIFQHFGARPVETVWSLKLPLRVI